MGTQGKGGGMPAPASGSNVLKTGGTEDLGFTPSTKQGSGGGMPAPADRKGK